MNRYGKKPAMLVGIVLLTLIFTSQLYSMNVFDNIPGSRENVEGYYPGAISGSAANEIVQLAGSNQVVRYVARNATTVTVGNTPAANNLTLAAPPAPASVLDATNASLKLSTTTFNTTHVIEDDAGINYPYAQSGSNWFNTSATRMPFALKNGTPSDPLGYKNLNYWTTFATKWIINSVNDFVRVDLEYPIASSDISGNQSIRIDLRLKLAFNRTVAMDVYVYDNRYGLGWVKANDVPFIFNGDVNEKENTTTVQVRDEHAQALRLTPTPCLNVSLRFTGSNKFRASLYQAQVKQYRAREFQVNGDKWIGFSFDLRGAATVHGFYMHVRSFSITSTENLMLTVFKTNNTSITLSQIGATAATPLYQKPDMLQKVASRTFTGYNGDRPGWFNLTTPVPMATGNYFLVVNSTVNTGQRYSVVVLPWRDDTAIIPRAPQTTVGHTVTRSINKGASWYRANFTISSLQRTVDGAPFKVGLQRGLIPTDINLKINGTAVQNWTMSRTDPFSSTNYEWGRGNWSRQGINARTTTTTFTIPITWNQTRQASFTYNATVPMRVYTEEPGASLLKLSGSAPLWKVSFQFNRTRYASWTGMYFNFTFPSDWSVLNVTCPDGVDYYRSSYVRAISTSRKMYPVNQTLINGLAPALQQLTYTSWFNSPNYTKSVETLLRYNATTLFKTPHFVNGDNMAARVHVQTGDGRAVFNGLVNATLFYPNGTRAFNVASTTINSTAGFVTRYHFNDASLHTFAGPAVGRHLMRVFWFNGSEAGIYYYDAFKVNYSVVGYSITEWLGEGVNQVSGSFFTGANESIPSNLVHMSIDRDDVKPLGIVVNQSISDITFMEFNQTQTVFNPGELVGFTVKMKSNSLFMAHQVSVNVQVVQKFSPDRVVMNLSSAPVTLDYIGGANPEHAFSFTGNFPSGSTGVNAPLRNSLYETRVNVYIDGYFAGTWGSSKTYSVNMGNTTDGTVLAAKIIPAYTGTSFSQLFTRANETVFNEKNMFLMLIESAGGVTLPDILARDFTNTMTSRITNLTVEAVPGEVLTINNTMTLAGALYLENGSVFVNTTSVQVSRYNGSAWVPFHVAGSTTNSSLLARNGTFSGNFLIPSTYNRTMSVKFTWAGVPSVVGTTQTMIINITRYTPSCTITIAGAGIVVLGGVYRNYFTVVVQNTG
ncbi:MAG: hypothetical protein GYA24_09720, partial [Candidatus Lokiarchaeota archaeon]|nr:hypothetical protein [Candidatus Lokiarchaeota archaeon]